MQKKFLEFIKNETHGSTKCFMLISSLFTVLKSLIWEKKSDFICHLVFGMTRLLNSEVSRASVMKRSVGRCRIQKVASSSFKIGEP